MSPFSSTQRLPIQPQSSICDLNSSRHSRLTRIRQLCSVATCACLHVFVHLALLLKYFAFRHSFPWTRVVRLTREFFILYILTYRFRSPSPAKRDSKVPKNKIEKRRNKDRDVDSEQISNATSRHVQESPPPSSNPELVPMPVVVEQKDPVHRAAYAGDSKPSGHVYAPRSVTVQSQPMAIVAQYGNPRSQMQAPVPMSVPMSPASQLSQGPIPYHQVHQPQTPQTPSHHAFISQHQQHTQQLQQQQQQQSQKPHLNPYQQFSLHQVPQQHHHYQAPTSSPAPQQTQHIPPQFTAASPSIAHHPSPQHHQSQYQQHPPQYQTQHHQLPQQYVMSPATTQPRPAMAAATPVHHHHQPQHQAQHQTQQNAYHPPGEVEVYTLGPQTNALIPDHIKKNFQQDENGNIIFFTKPPLERKHKGVGAEHAHLGHSARYLADRARDMRNAMLAKNSTSATATAAAADDKADGETKRCRTHLLLRCNMKVQT